ncbi:hypothetical protein EJ02DRAFT_166209 [Clathrospora elynae]|uniref:Uncharacterized protein n=1 Tax=Clathrospora elynae TaxID=706981 RepID=A0A6A5SPF0_9PLEO|nr:hypothetical protein EJ02DRAFT_166209 [Clathrospora elynae]
MISQPRHNQRDTNITHVQHEPRDAYLCFPKFSHSTFNMQHFQNNTPSLSLSRNKHRHTSSSTSGFPTSTEPSAAPPQPNSQIDHNAAVALAVIFFLVLGAVAWYLYSHVRVRRVLDLERQGVGERGGDMWFRQDSVGSSRGRCGNGEEVERGGGGVGSIFSMARLSLKKGNSGLGEGRKDSVVTCSTSSSEDGSPETTPEERRRQKKHDDNFSSSLSSRTPPSQHNSWLPLSSPLPPRTIDDRPPSLQPDTLPLSSTERPSPTYAHSRRHSHSIPSSTLYIMNPPSNTPPPLPRRRATLSQTQYDKRWWAEVARRGSTSSATRRLSVLEPILEPEVRGWEDGEGNVVGKSGSGGVRGDRGRNSVGAGGESCHKSWRGSRCESMVYDWTRPTDDEVQRGRRMVETGHSTGVVWNEERKETGLDRTGKSDQGIQRLDWASMT